MKDTTEATRTAGLVRLLSALVEEYTELAGNLIEHLPESDRAEAAERVTKTVTEVTRRLDEIVNGPATS